MALAETSIDFGQSLWLDNISRRMLDDGTLEHYRTQFGITGLTSNPSIFDKAMGEGDAYDKAIRERAARHPDAEELFTELALEDLRRAADLFRPVYDATGGIDGWVSMEVSPLLASDTPGTIAAAKRIQQRAGRANLYVKIPGTPAGLPAIEEAIFQGVPVNVTLLFSRKQYLAAAEAYMRGVERRLASGLDANVSSVASLFVSRWDKPANERVETSWHNTLGIAVAQRAYVAYRDLLTSPRWQRAAEGGAKPQRLLFASTGTKDPAASETLYADALALPGTVDTMPDKTLRAYADLRSNRQARVARSAAEGDHADQVLSHFEAAGIDIDALATQLQLEGAKAFVDSWKHLLDGLSEKIDAMTPVEGHHP